MPQVRVRAMQTVYYDQVVTLSDEEWEEYQEKEDDEDSQEQWFQEFAEKWIDVAIIEDSDTFDDVTAELHE